VESTAENVLSVIYNQAVSFTEIGNKATAVIAKVKESENNTKAVVLASAGRQTGRSCVFLCVYSCAC
jgi:hypothetical protein